MCQASLDLGNREIETNHKRNAEESLKDLTCHEHARVVNSGNSAIMIAMNNIKGPVLLPDQVVGLGLKNCRFFRSENIIPSYKSWNYQFRSFR